MALTDTAIRKAQPGTKDWKLADEKGLYLLVTTKGSKLWRLKYRHQGKEKKLALGSYPEVTLAQARAKRDDARSRIEHGADPGHEKKMAKLNALTSAANTFEVIADEYIEKRQADGVRPHSEATTAKAKWFLSLLKPTLGSRPITEITPAELLDVLRKVERRGNLETAQRLRSFSSRVFRHAIATARATDDPAQLLSQALTSPTVKHRAAILDPVELGGLLRAVDGFQGQPITRIALQLLPHVFVRPGELRHAEWTELDLEAAIWRIPAGRTKMRREHVVPLSKQSVAILKNAAEISAGGKYVFPGARVASRPMSENTLNAALRRLGFTKDEVTSHGFRATASSLLNESGKWSPDAIERALAHKDANAVRAAYNRSPFWAERVAMSQWWSDYLDALRSGAKIIPFDERRAG